MISDAHTGLIAAIGTVMQGTALQRCRVHFMRNVLTQVPKHSRKACADNVGCSYYSRTYVLGVRRL